MAGHNEWSKMQRLMGALDAKRGKLFGQLAGEITFAALTGGGSPARDPRRPVPARLTPGRNTLHGQPATIGDSELRVGSVSATSSRRPKSIAPGTHRAAPIRPLCRSAMVADRTVKKTRATVEFSNAFLIHNGA